MIDLRAVLGTSRAVELTTKASRHRGGGLKVSGNRRATGTVARTPSEPKVIRELGDAVRGAREPAERAVGELTATTESSSSIEILLRLAKLPLDRC